MSSGKKVNFNDEDSLQDIVKQITKDQKKNSKSDWPQKLIGMFTKNMGITAGAAIYLIICGLIGNVIFIARNPLASIIIISTIVISYIVLIKLNKNKTSASLATKISK